MQQKDLLRLVDRRTLAMYGIFMADVLAYIRKRRAELAKELEDLNTAERVYRQATSTEAGNSDKAPEEVAPNSVVAEAARWAARPRTIKEMVRRLLEEKHPNGLTALEILGTIQKRWMPTLERTSLSPQLTRLKLGGYVENRVGKWFVATPQNEADDSVERSEAQGRNENAPPETTDGAP